MKRNSVIIMLMASIVLGGVLQGCSDEEPNVTTVRYNADVTSIMSNYCLTCHSGDAPEANLNLDSYQDVRSIGETGKLVDRINDAANPMPPSGLMPENKRQQIMDWVEGGYQE